MQLENKTPKQSLNKAYLKEKITRLEIEAFKKEFKDLLSKIDSRADEEHLKSLIADFLKNTWYKAASYQVNPKEKNDLVIHLRSSPKEPIGVILEVKSPTNKSEKVGFEKPNTKALHELIFFECPEALNGQGDFIGFDLVIGNPPYGVKAKNEEKKHFKNTFEVIIGKYDSYGFFIEIGIRILKDKGILGYIIPILG